VGDPATFRPERLASAAVTLPIGPGAYGHYSYTQLANVFDLGEYARRMAAGHSPLWRGRRLSADEAFHRDVMFALKNDPFIDCRLFRTAYNRSPLEVFAATFEHLFSLGFITAKEDEIHLTPKGRLCVEEIAGLFRHPAISRANGAGALSELLVKHNFAPSYPAVEW
jgi:oxygen-independent coproporphyrinogen-3 oxidase